MGEKIKILLVGTLHMNQYGDIIQKKQAEIKQVVHCLSQFKPTKIAVEWLKEDRETLINDFNHYLEHGNLTNDEIQQIAFRLAKALNHSTLYPVNDEGKLTEADVTTLFSEAEKNDPDSYQLLLDFIKQQLEPSEAISIMDVYKQINDGEQIKRLRQLYLSFTTVKRGDKRLGIDFLTKWQERELGIFANLLQISNRKEDRILFLIGSDHLWTLKYLLEGVGLFEIEEVNDYLS
ncbi:hypothetical protein JOD43_001103 [Pullulanibacillus pueri]|uniref:Uncharacterized protein n=1 Tax=Pullulanibacillus pueri TaxID=1437324 RepID=A0A8J3ELZ8_9BACL|nr:DUF5694 domain-containing protein [Pullulanibacillus pueri]MBM7680937.1 hypothetical protein [Pullulanibacillus pueri]GGH81406.1 hypothetical protein GCM10007096_19260 [Pullulanibacillus pueri]